MNVTPLALSKLILFHLNLPETKLFSVYCIVVGATVQRAVEIQCAGRRGEFCLCIDTIGYKAYLVKDHHLVLFHTSIDIMSFDQIMKEYRQFTLSLLE